MDTNDIVQRYNRAKSDRDSGFLPLWNESRRYVTPNKQADQAPGGERTQDIYDSTATYVATRTASGLYAWCCPPDKRWFEFRAEDEELQKIDRVSSWWSECTRIAAEAMANSNWSLMFHEVAMDLVHGNGILYTEEGDRTKLNFLCVPFESFCGLEDKESRIDTVFREFEYTARQCAQEFGRDKCTEEMQKALDDPKRMEEKFRILHAVFPNADRQHDKMDETGKPYCSVYIALKEKQELAKSGYWENPYVVIRWSKTENEVYGRGPAVDYLPEIRMLNRMRKAKIYGVELANDPPVLIPDDALLDSTFRTYPGGVNYYRATAGMKPETFLIPNQTQVTQEEIDQTRQIIWKDFLCDMFDALEDRKNMTATEVVERIEAKLVPFAPVLGRMQSEGFNPLLSRVFGILYRAGAFPEPPPEVMMSPGYKIEYVSRIALAIKQLEARSFTQTMERLLPFAEVRPEVFDNFDFDKIARGLARGDGMPSDWMVPEDQVMEMRLQKAQQMQQQQMLEQLPNAAKALPALGQSPQPGSPLEAIQGGLGNGT